MKYFAAIMMFLFTFSVYANDDDEEIDPASFRARVQSYLTIGASYSYGAGALGNNFVAPGVDISYQPGSGLAYSSEFKRVLERRARNELYYLNTAVVGAVSQEILDDQLTNAIRFAGFWRNKAFIEIAMGGNDILSLFLFPRLVELVNPDAVAACFVVTPAANPFGNLYTFTDNPICEEVFRAIIAEAELNTTEFVDVMVNLSGRKSIVALRNFANPGIGVPPELEGATCIQALPDLYGVSLQITDVEKYLNGKISEGETINGLNTVLRRIARTFNIPYVNINGITAGEGTYFDCIHPSQVGHDRIVQRYRNTIL